MKKWIIISVAATAMFAQALGHGRDAVDDSYVDKYLKEYQDYKNSSMYKLLEYFY